MGFEHGFKETLVATIFNHTAEDAHIGPDKERDTPRPATFDYPFNRKDVDIIHKSDRSDVLCNSNNSL